MAALFLLCFLKFGLSMTGVGAAVLCFLLVGLTVMDAETLLLPDAFTLPGIALGVLFSALSGSGNGLAGEATLWSGHPRVSAMVVSVATAGVAWGLILLIRWAYWLVRRQEGMGLGDAKFMAMIGAWFGPTATFLVFLLAVVCGAIYGITVIVVARLSRARVADDLRPPVPTKVPLGAFLGLASLYTLFWGAQTLRWYFGLFL